MHTRHHFLFGFRYHTENNSGNMCASAKGFSDVFRQSVWMLLLGALCMIMFAGCTTSRSMHKQHVFALRLSPGQDLKQEILRFTKANQLDAAYIITCVGSLQTLGLRFANQQLIDTRTGKFEIVSLVGTMNASDEAHLHLSVSDEKGQTIGGHLSDGNIIYTTAEIVIGNMNDHVFRRVLDSTTTYKELKVDQK
jgi:uncharacterized protein